jgi:hypothetical protein
MKKLFTIALFCTFGFLLPTLLFAQTNNDFAKKVSPQNMPAASKDSSGTHIDSIHASKGMMFRAVTIKQDTAKNKPGNEQFQKKMPAQVPAEEKQTSSPAK